MRCHTQADMDTAYFEENVEQVVKQLDGLAGIEFDIVILDDLDHCHRVVDELPITDETTFKETCRDAATSVSYRAAGEEIIVIKADKPFITEDAAALRGLLAHELMHVVHRHDGTEEAIQNVAKQHTQDIIADLQDHGLTDQEIGHFIGTTYATAIFCLKDIYANTDLIEQGFTADLEAYYENMIGLDEYCKVPDFYGREATVEDVANAMAFELGLLPAWLPFYTLDREASNSIRRRIKDCYERDLPQLAAHMQSIVDLYQEIYDETDTFKHRFFEHVIDSAIHVITARTDIGE